MTLNNIIFILQSVHSFPQELGKDDILSKIGEVNGALVAEACKKTIDVLVKNATLPHIAEIKLRY